MSKYFHKFQKLNSESEQAMMTFLEVEVYDDGDGGGGGVVVVMMMMMMMMMMMILEWMLGE
jgi:hypothetical protein